VGKNFNVSGNFFTSSAGNDVINGKGKCLSYGKVLALYYSDFSGKIS